MKKKKEGSMREIKFRAWHKQEKDMYHFINFSGVNDYYNGDLMTLKCGFPDELVLMQYTGLKDKNGKEIYEGDIVRREFTKYRKTVFSKMKVVKFGYKHRYSGYGLAKETKTYKVIGNIYENPELLKVKCPICGKPHSNKKFCSKQCYWKSLVKIKPKGEEK